MPGIPENKPRTPDNRPEIPEQKPGMPKKKPGIPENTPSIPENKPGILVRKRERPDSSVHGRRSAPCREENSRLLYKTFSYFTKQSATLQKSELIQKIVSYLTQ